MRLQDRMSLDIFEVSQLDGQSLIPQQYVLMDNWHYNSKYIVPKGTVLCGDESNQLTWVGSGIHKLNFIEHELSDNIRAAITQIANAMNGWVNAHTVVPIPSPLIPRQVFEQDSELNKLEKMLEKVVEAGHLHEITNRPRIDMRYEDQLMPISRAKKIATSAHRHLAMRSETWQQRTLGGVYPKKIMARLSEDEWQLYENKVYVRLLDKLRRFLNHRLSELIERKKNIEDGLNLKGGEECYHKLMDAICDMWGENWQDSSIENTLEQLNETISKLERLLFKIGLLRQVGLYLKIPQASQVPDQLHMTNILSHDQNYRHVGRLWNQLYQSKGRTFSAAEKLEHNINLQKDYSTFSLLVICRAFTQLGFEFATLTDEKFLFRKRSLNIEISRDMTSAWVLSSTASRNKLRIVPILNQPSEQAKFGDDQSNIIFFLSLRETAADCIDDTKAKVSSSMMLHANPLNFDMVETFIGDLLPWLYQDLLSDYAKPSKLGSVLRSVRSVLEQSDGLNVTADDYVLVQCLTEHNLELIRIACDEANTPKVFEGLKVFQDNLTLLQYCPLCDNPAKFQPRDLRAFIAICTDAECGATYAIKNDGQQKRNFVLNMESSSESPLQSKWGRWKLSFRIK